jgi:hypothetical protein
VKKFAFQESRKQPHQDKQAVRTDGLFNFAGTPLQDAFDAAGFFAQAAAFLRFR